MPHMPGFGNWIIIAVIGLLVFGKRLPEVGKSVAGAIVNFKKGLKEAQEEISHADAVAEQRSVAVAKTPAALPSDAKFDPYTGKAIDRPRFDPYTGKPLVEETETVVSHGEPS